MPDYVLNQASLVPLFEDIQLAQDELAELLQALAALDDGPEALPRFRSLNDPWATPLVEGSDQSISMGEVANTFYGTDRHDLAAYFDSLGRMSPPDADVNDEAIIEYLSLELEQSAVNHELCFPLASEASSDTILCTVTGAILVGFPRQNKWQFDHLAFSSGEQEYTIDHASSADHSRSVLNRRIVGIQQQITQRNFWELKNRAFPFLDFGRDVEAQIHSFDGGLLNLLFFRLTDLNHRCAEWQATGIFPVGLPAIVPESGATMATYGNARSFRDSAGNRCSFEEHIRVDRLFRVHLKKDENSRRIEIGYIGRHLPTVNHPT